MARASASRSASGRARAAPPEAASEACRRWPAPWPGGRARPTGRSRTRGRRWVLNLAGQLHLAREALGPLALTRVLGADDLDRHRDADGDVERPTTTPIPPRPMTLRTSYRPAKTVPSGSGPGPSPCVPAAGRSTAVTLSADAPSSLLSLTPRASYPNPSANNLRSDLFRTPLSQVEAVSLPCLSARNQGLDWDEACPRRLSGSRTAAGTRRRSSRFSGTFRGLPAAKSTRLSLTSVRTRTRSALAKRNRSSGPAEESGSS